MEPATDLNGDLLITNHRKLLARVWQFSGTIRIGCSIH